MKKPFLIFLSLVFFSAGLFRLIFFEAGVREFAALRIPVIFLVLAIIIEMGGAVLLWFKPRLALWIIGALVVVGLVSAALQTDWSTIDELFRMNPTPTSIFLHITYLVIIGALLYES